MTEVRLTIGGVAYKVACAPGEEDQVLELGSVIEGKLQQLSGNLSTSSAQNLLFAALLLADELKEAKDNGGHSTGASQATAQDQSAISDLRLELDAMRTERDESLRELALLRQANEAAPPSGTGPELLEILEQVAASLESCASSLEEKAPAT